MTRARVVAALTLATVVTATAACGTTTRREYRNGYVQEVELGRNGKKVEVRDGDGTDDESSLEFYLIPGSPCRVGDMLEECADHDDFLVPPPGATPGVNPSTTRR